MPYLLYKTLGWLFDLSSVVIGPKIPNGLNVQDIEIKNGVKLRIYKPTLSKNKLLPVVIYYHGGGWVIGSIKAYDKILRYLSYKSGCIVVSVGYRKAPQYKFPTALEDAMLGYNWVINNVNRIGCNQDKIALMGDSAGGNIAALVQAQLTKTNKKLSKLLILVYPIVDVSIKALNEIKKDKRWLTATYGHAILSFCLRHYLDNLKEKNLMKLSLPVDLRSIRNLPRTLIITAEIDSLNKSIRSYVNKLRKAGVTVVVKHYPGTIHGFLNFAGVSKKAKKALDDIVAFLNGEFS